MAHPLDLAKFFHELEHITLQSLQLHSILANSSSVSMSHSVKVSVSKPVEAGNFSGTQIEQVQARPKLSYFRKTPGIYHPILKT
jgi:hypothetical protein